jgi:hypothetical protein
VHLDASKAAVAKGRPSIKLSDDCTVTAPCAAGTVVTRHQPGPMSNYLDVVVASPRSGRRPRRRPSPRQLRAVVGQGVLAVPVRALLALAEGGYAVERAAPRELVGVQLASATATSRSPATWPRATRW